MSSDNSIWARRWRHGGYTWRCDIVDAGRSEAERARHVIAATRRETQNNTQLTARNAGFWVSKDNAPQGPSNEAENVYLDSHIYACFVDDLKAMTPQQHIRQVCKFERDHIVRTHA